MRVLVLVPPPSLGEGARERAAHSYDVSSCPTTLQTWRVMFHAPS